MTTIQAKKDLFNGGKCFTKSRTYTVNSDVKTEAGLMDARTINDQNEPHIIGAYWRDFKIVK